MKKLALGFLISLVLVLLGCKSGSEVTASLAPYGPGGAGVYKSKEISCSGSDSYECQLLFDLVSGEKVPGIVLGKEVAALAPISERAVCSRQGGPLLQAKLAGEIDGKKVDAVFFAWRGGCEANRWRVVSPLFSGLVPESSFAAPIPG